MGEVEWAFFPRAGGRATGGLELRGVIFGRQGDRVLLVRHQRHPVYEGAWTLPGGTLLYGVSPRESAAKVLHEQTAVSAKALRLLGVQSSMERDWILTFQFETQIEGNTIPGKGIAETRLVPLAEEFPEDLDRGARTELEKYRIHEMAKSR